MKYLVRIRRQKSADEPAYWQEFFYDADGRVSVAAMLKELNERRPLLDREGNRTEPIAWDCGCMSRKCGACSLRINGVPGLACATFLEEQDKGTVTVEPLSRFPVVKDLRVDKQSMFDALKKLELYLKSSALNYGRTQELRYMSSKCLMCGCCLEVCPNYHEGNGFTGAVGAVNAYRILSQEQDAKHLKTVRKQCEKHFLAGCGTSLACHEICPAGISVEELTSRTNAVIIWNRR